jgi:hypothetical protein
VTQLIAGTKKRFPNGSQKLTFGGVDRTVDEITASLQSFVNNRTAVETAQADAKAKVDAERAQAPALLVLITEYVQFIRLTFGNQASALLDFGVPPPKTRAPLTAEQKAVAAAKRAATRQARGTTSKKAKRSIKGNVTAKLVVTPEGAPQQPSAAAPAPGGAGTGAPAPSPAVAGAAGAAPAPGPAAAPARSS